MATDYSKLDAALLAAVDTYGPAFFSRLLTREVVILAKRAARKDWPGEVGRIVDRRLQALRKAGRIRYQRKPEGWVLVQKAEA